MAPANVDQAALLLPQHRCARPAGDVVLFAFDEVGFPFREGVRAKDGRLYAAYVAGSR